MTQEQFNMIQQLVGSPEFQAIRQQAQANPQIIPQLLQFLQQSNPQLFQLLSQNPNLLAALLLGQGENGDLEGDLVGDEVDDVALDLTDEDYAAIETLKGLGFSEQQCIEAYLVCNKDSELAINYLLDSVEGAQQGYNPGNQ